MPCWCWRSLSCALWGCLLRTPALCVMGLCECTFVGPRTYEESAQEVGDSSKVPPPRKVGLWTAFVTCSETGHNMAQRVLILETVDMIVAARSLVIGSKLDFDIHSDRLGHEIQTCPCRGWFRQCGA